MQTKQRSRRAAPKRAKTVVASDWTGADVFGAQSQWSALLGQREHLQKEIKRERNYLELLRKSRNGYSGLLPAWPAYALEIRDTWMPSPSGQDLTGDALERFLVSWLERLEQRLSAVMNELEELEMPNGRMPHTLETSMFELLRAVG